MEDLNIRYLANLDDVLTKYLPNRNPSTQLYAYIKKQKLPSKIHRMTSDEKTEWFDKRKHFFEEVLVRCDLNAMVKNLMRNDYYAKFNLELERIRGPGMCTRKNSFCPMKRKFRLKKAN